MMYSALNNDGSVKSSSLCIEDSNVGFEANFSENGEVDGWDYYSGVHTYGCWNGCLFGTVWRESPAIGRSTTFSPVLAEYFYTVRLTMKLRLVDRAPGQATPTHGKFAWRSLDSPTWNSYQQQEFDLYTDTEWHTYIINMGENPFWQGSINDLRLYILGDAGKDGDRFFISTLEISSVNVFRCNKLSCSYYNNFKHNCPGVGERGYCKSEDLASVYIQGSLYDMTEEILYTIEEGINDVLIVNINGYGREAVQLPSRTNINGVKLAMDIERELSKVDIGGYSECMVEYTGRGAFIIYAGNYASDSTVEVEDTLLARQLNFYDESGNNISTKVIGTNPASGYRPASSFKIKPDQINSLMDPDENTEFFFNPFSYGIEAGRNDWLMFGLGDCNAGMRGAGTATTDSTGLKTRTYHFIDNAGKTIIEFNHPFNASGRINKIYAGVTLDVDTNRGGHDDTRIANQLSSAKIMFFRPRKDGSFKVLPTEIAIPDRNHASGKLYSSSQEYTEIDCDIIVNKGDFIGVYNANVFKGPSISGEEIDALYYQIDGKPPSGSIVSVDVPEGAGSAGLMLYARSDYQQKRLVLDIDFGKRINLESVSVLGYPTNPVLEYNIARCLDINWKVNLFNGDWTDHYSDASGSIIIPRYYNHPSIAYGTECLSDGIKIVTDGLAADSFSKNYTVAYMSEAEAEGKQDGGKGLILNNPKYFSINADSEWLGIYVFVQGYDGLGIVDVRRMDNFDHDPIAFTLTFPNDSSASIHKSVIYFKEKFNFRSFALSTYNGPTSAGGDADDDKYSLIPYRLDGYNTPWKSISLDGVEYTPEKAEKWSGLNLYLSQNPCQGDKVLKYYSATSAVISNMDQYVQSLYIDWTVLQHEWEPITCKGFRFYTNYHESTKICEMEVYAALDADESELTSALSLLYSAYEDYWTFGDIKGTDSGAELFVGDTPQKAQLIIRPSSELYLSTISLNISAGDVYMGEKGCETTILPIEAKTGNDVNNVAKRVDFKNIYGHEYDLYVSLADDVSSAKDTVFYSILDSSESVYNPEIGPDAYYKKSPHYPLRHSNNNVAINCPVHALVNLAHDAEVWYSHDNKLSWERYGTFDEAEELNFSNLPNASITTLCLPRKVRSKWWKIGFLDGRISTGIKELKLYRDEEEIVDAVFYHHKGQDAYIGGNTDTAPHLQDGVVDGSYYVLKGNQYIGIELPDVNYIDKIVFYHDVLTEIENSHDIGGVDKITGFLLRSEGLQLETDYIKDYSYYEHPIAVVGSGIYNDLSDRYVSYNFHETFSGCNFQTTWEDYTPAYSYNSIYSTYTCLSGVCPTVSGGYARGFSFWAGMAVGGAALKDGTYNVSQIYSPQLYPIDQDYTFTLRFVCKGGTALLDGATNNTSYGFSVGILGSRKKYFAGYSSWYPSAFSTGPQISITQYEIRIVVKDNYNTFVQGNYFRNLNPQNNVYYYELTGDGKGTYSMTVRSGSFSGTIVAQDTLTTSTKWSANRIGVGPGAVQYTYYKYLASGWIGDVQFTSSKLGSAKGITGSSTRFSGYQNSYLQVDYDNSPHCNYSNSILSFSNLGFCIDFRIRPNSIPNNYTDVFWIVGQWHPNQPLSGSVIYPSSWLLYAKRTAVDTIKMYFIYNNSGTVYTFIIGTLWLEINRWAHIYVGQGFDYSNNIYWYPFIIKNGYTVLEETYWVNTRINITNSSADLIVGKGFDGNIEELRISCDPYAYRSKNFNHLMYYLGYANEDINTAPVPTNPYERYYTFCMYDSADNMSYGKTMDVDITFSATNLEYVFGSEWSKGYYTYLAFDLGQRHDLWLIRSFPVDTAYQFTLSTNTLFSNKDTSDPMEAFYITEEERIISNDFSGQDYSFPNNWSNIGTSNSSTYILDNKLYQKVISNVDAQACIESKFYLLNDFDISVDYSIGTAGLEDKNTWILRIGAIDINNSNNAVWFERAYSSSHNRYKIYVQDNSSTLTAIADWWSTDKEATLRIVRVGNVFNFYTKNIDQTEEEFLIRVYYKFASFGIETKAQIIAKTSSTNYPKVEVWWDNFTLRSGNPIFSSSQDARWVKVKMYNGDGVTRTVQRLGIYPDVTTLLTSDGKHNCKWKPLGTAVTNYVNSENVALGATISGSSYAGYMRFENIADGVIPGNDLNMCWGSDNAQEKGLVNPWIEIALPNVEQIYRVKVYHGYNDSDTDNMITDYKIHVSEDSINYTTIFNITGNSSFECIHDLTYPVSAKYIKLEVVSFKSSNMTIITPEGTSRYWEGAVLREVEVYRYYGFTFVNSEENPVIAIDLQETYYIYGHSLVGVTTSVRDTDWDNSDSNFTYANSDLSDPSKIAFRPWGSAPGYDSWVLVKRNTATHYPSWTAPSNLDMPDLLKHVIIKATMDEDNTPINPIEYPWMWKSSISTLSYNYDYLSEERCATRSLKIAYPASTLADHVYFVEGDDFGWDDRVVFRDGFGINIYIDNINNLDLTYGYIYFGGYDASQAANPIIHRWNFSTISGSLNSGWNILHLNFSKSDHLDYTRPPATSSDPDPRLLHTINWGSTGIWFKGKGNPLTMYIDGCNIRRTHFESGGYKGQGLYLSSSDFLKINLASIDFNSTTVEFWIRPDWDFCGVGPYFDYYNRTLFHFGNTSNDVFGVAVSDKGINMYYGNVLKNFHISYVDLKELHYKDSCFHMAFVISNNGKSISSDGSTIRMYINNNMVAKTTTTWEVSDNKHYNFMLGAGGLLAQKAKSLVAERSSIDGVINRLKIHDYCKTDFSDSIGTVSTEYTKRLYRASEFIEISKDNLTFVKVGSNELPFYFERVPAGESVPIWVKITLPDGLTGSESRTAGLVGSWDIGV